MSGSLQKMMQKLGCDVIDYRQWHPNDHFGVLKWCAHVHAWFLFRTNEMYVRDDHVRLPTAVDMSAEQNVKLRERIDAILDATRAALHEDEHDGAEIRVQRWLPGSHLEGSRLVANEDAKERIEVLASDTNVYRGADGKLHGKSYGPWRSTSHSRKAKSAKETLTHSSRTRSTRSSAWKGLTKSARRKGPSAKKTA